MWTLLFVVILVNFAHSAHLPPTFQKCSQSQGDFNECLSQNIKDAIAQLTKPKKEIGIPKIDPLHIPSLVIGAGSSAVQFSQNYKNVQLNGLSKPSTLKAKMDFEQNTLTLDLNYPEIKMDFEYSINGKILILPIYGNGTGVITLDQPHFVLSYFLEKYDKNGKPHFKVTKTDLLIEPKQVHFQLENLFNGDKNLGENVLQVMNENWKEVYLDVQSSYEEAFARIFSAICNSAFERVSIPELFDP